MGRLGIIAGGGALPARLADIQRQKGQEVFVLGLKGQTDSKLKVDAWSRLGATDAAIQVLKENGVTHILMAGAVRRPSLAEMKPDWRTIQLFARLGAKAFGDDELLRAVAGELEGEGFKIVGAHEIDPSLLVSCGVLGKVAPHPEHQEDIQKGIEATKILGALDIGQAAVVQQGIVLALEAVEGTNALLDRAKHLRRQGRGGVLVKACKPQQDRRFDLPTIGLKTLRKSFAAGLEGIAIETGAALLLNRDEVLRTADDLGLFIFGFES